MVIYGQATSTIDCSVYESIMNPLLFGICNLCLQFGYSLSLGFPPLYLGCQHSLPIALLQNGHALNEEGDPSLPHIAHFIGKIFCFIPSLLNNYIYLFHMRSCIHKMIRPPNQLCQQQPPIQPHLLSQLSLRWRRLILSGLHKSQQVYQK